jgi:thiamine biosynthesis lipoprotein
MKVFADRPVAIQESVFRSLGSDGSLVVLMDDRALFEKALDEILAVMAEVETRFDAADQRSELSALQRGDLEESNVSDVMQRVLDGCRLVEAMTEGAFRPRDPAGHLDPSGFVNGWAIKRAGLALRERGLTDWCLTVGGDVQTSGSRMGRDWRVAIERPQDVAAAAVLAVAGASVATSGTRSPDHPQPQAAHVWNVAGELHATPGSMTVVGPSIDIADALATGFWAMGDRAFGVIERLPEYHLLEVTCDGIRTSKDFPYLVDSVDLPDPARA